MGNSFALLGNNFHFWEISLVLVVVQSLGKEQQWQQMICASGLSHLFLLRLDHRDGDDHGGGGSDHGDGGDHDDGGGDHDGFLLAGLRCVHRT